MTTLYSALLHLYPRRFRDAFGSEMEGVFADAAAEARRAGIASVTAVYVREFRDLPSNLFREHALALKEDPMTTKRFLTWGVIFAALLVLDWFLGVQIVAGRLPLWSFLIPNIPFGALHVWLESSWTGTQYQWLGMTLGDMASLVIFLGVVFAQSLLYSFMLEAIRKKHQAARTV